MTTAQNRLAEVPVKRDREIFDQWMELQSRIWKSISADPKTRAATIVHISASNIMSDHQVQGLDCGADSYLVEPVDPRVLIATIKAFLRAREAEDALRQSNEELQ